MANPGKPQVTGIRLGPDCPQEETEPGMLIFGKAHSSTWIWPDKLISYAQEEGGAPGALPVGLIQNDETLFKWPIHH